MFILKLILHQRPKSAQPCTEHPHPRNRTSDLVEGALLCRLQQGVLDVYLES